MEREAIQGTPGLAPPSSRGHHHATAVELTVADFVQFHSRVLHSSGPVGNVQGDGKCLNIFQQASKLSFRRSTVLQG